MQKLFGFDETTIFIQRDLLSWDKSHLEVLCERIGPLAMPSHPPMCVMQFYDQMIYIFGIELTNLFVTEKVTKPVQCSYLKKRNLPKKSSYRYFSRRGYEVFVFLCSSMVCLHTVMPPMMLV